MTDKGKAMTNPQELIALAERVEGLTGPDRTLDELIADALFEKSHFAQLADAPLGVGCMMWWQGGHQQSALRYTGSLDAAMSLVPEEWTAWEMRSHARKTRFSVDLSRLTECDAGNETWAHGRGVTPAIALTAACLRALAQKETGK
jgi:hypothetical protein